MTFFHDLVESRKMMLLLEIMTSQYRYRISIDTGCPISTNTGYQSESIYAQHYFGASNRWGPGLKTVGKFVPPPPKLIHTPYSIDFQVRIGDKGKEH